MSANVLSGSRLAVGLVAAILLASPAVQAGPARWDGRARALATAADCEPLPPPEGRVVRVSTDAELQAAVRALRDDTTLLLAPGEYRLSHTLHLYGGLKRVAIRGEGGDRSKVVLRGPGMARSDFGDVPHGILVSGVQGLLVADLTIADVYYHAIQVQGEAGARDVQVYNTVLLDAGEQLIKGSTAGPPGPYADGGLVACSWLGYTDRARSDYTNGVDVLAGADWVVRDNAFVRIRAPIGQLAGPAVLFWRNSLRTVVERNTFLECDRPIALGLSEPDPARARDGDTRHDHQAGVIRNNAIYRAAGARTGDIGITVNHHPDYKILHNTVIQNGTFPQGTIEHRFDDSWGVIAGNLTDGPIWRRDGSRADLEANVLTARPDWFVDAPAGDLHLRPGAAGAVDEVAPRPDVPDDLDGQPRPAGPRADAGADEVVMGEVAPTPSPSPSPPPPPTAAPEVTPTLAPTRSYLWLPRLTG